VILDKREHRAQLVLQENRVLEVRMVRLGNKDQLDKMVRLEKRV
jgi:hypothetical protein